MYVKISYRVPRYRQQAGYVVATYSESHDRLDDGRAFRLRRDAEAFALRSHSPGTPIYSYPKNAVDGVTLPKRIDQ